MNSTEKKNIYYPFDNFDFYLLSKLQTNLMFLLEKKTNQVLFKK